MGGSCYQQLNTKGEPASVYRKRLQAFAILHRFERASNYSVVAEKIVRLNLVAQFNEFSIPDVATQTNRQIKET